MGPKTKELLSLVSEMYELLRSDMDDHWSRSFAKAGQELMNGDLHGIERILGMYGGMGSLNDVILGQQVIDGKHSYTENAPQLNERFMKLKSEIYALANWIKRNAEVQGAEQGAQPDAFGAG
jgi:hypothetical protein